MAFMPNVYIVDDDVMAGHLLGQVLSAAGFAARSFASAQDFLDAAPWLAPGCLVADVRMPGIDGLELLRRLTERAMPFPAVMISGYADIPMAVRAIKIGAVEFVEKPFSEETILASIARAQDRLTRSGEKTDAADAARARLGLNASETYSKVWSPASPTRHWPTTSASVSARWRAIGPASWKKCRPAICPIWCGSPWSRGSRSLLDLI
jgi:FixJ family two-component response regulator